MKKNVRKNFPKKIIYLGNSNILGKTMISNKFVLLVNADVL